MEQGGVYPTEKKRKWGSAHSVSHAQVRDGPACAMTAHFARASSPVQWCSVRCFGMALATCVVEGNVVVNALACRTSSGKHHVRWKEIIALWQRFEKFAELVDLDL
jgi:hypothetical protein